MSLISEKVQEGTFKWLTAHGPFFFLVVALGAIMVYEAHEDRAQRTRLMENMRQMEVQRLTSISETMARVAEACDSHSHEDFDVGPR